MLAYTIFFAALLSVDSFGVGIALGANNTKMSFQSKLLVALISAFFALLSCLVGAATELVFGGKFTSVVGAILLIVSGAVLLTDTLKPSYGDRDGSGEISRNEALLLGIALSADMLGAGTGFVCGAEKTSLFPLFAGVFQYGFISIGSLCGKKLKIFKHISSKTLGILPGLTVIFFGIIKLIGAF